MSNNKDLEFNIEEIEQIIAPSTAIGDQDISIDDGEIDPGDGGGFGDAINGGGSGRATNRHCPTRDITCGGNGGGGDFFI